MNVSQIVIAHLQSIGADGLCREDCGCGIDEILACVGYLDAYVDNCVPAKRTCDDGRENPCYRPIDTPNEPEETHL